MYCELRKIKDLLKRRNKKDDGKEDEDEWSEAHSPATSDSNCYDTPRVSSRRNSVLVRWAGTMMMKNLRKEKSIPARLDRIPTRITTNVPTRTSQVIFSSTHRLFPAYFTFSFRK